MVHWEITIEKLKKIKDNMICFPLVLSVAVRCVMLFFILIAVRILFLWTLSKS